MLNHPHWQCSGSPGNERAGDNQNHLNDLNDELALLIGIERLGQLFNLYCLLPDIIEEHRDMERVCPKTHDLNGWQPQKLTY